MPGEKENRPSVKKAVAVRMAGAFGKEPTLLFASRQTEEVLPEVEVAVHPLPFAPQWLLGLCVWRLQVLPVLDAAKLYGFDPVVGRHLYLVLRTPTVATGEDGRSRILRCLIKVPGLIATQELPAQCVPVSAEANGLEPTLVRGVFAHENGLLIVPDLRSVLAFPTAYGLTVLESVPSNFLV